MCIVQLVTYVTLHCFLTSTVESYSTTLVCEAPKLKPCIIFVLNVEFSNC